MIFSNLLVQKIDKAIPMEGGVAKSAEECGFAENERIVVYRKQNICTNNLPSEFAKQTISGGKDKLAWAFRI
jgi:hypothetical protein